jgi:hypothetical protein
MTARQMDDQFAQFVRSLEVSVRDIYREDGQLDDVLDKFAQLMSYIDSDQVRDVDRAWLVNARQNVARYVLLVLKMTTQELLRTRTEEQEREIVARYLKR